MARVVFITGANTGIGFQIVRALYSSSKESYQILLGSRSLANAQNAINAVKAESPSSHSTIVPVQIDIEKDDSIQAAYSQIESEVGKLDILVNNAGAQFDAQFSEGKITERELWNKTWDVNVTGTQIVTTTFVPLLLRSADSRLIFVTSGTSTLEYTENLAWGVNHIPAKGWPKQGFFGMPAYRSAKTGLNMMMREWYRILKDDKVKVWALQPGFLATGLVGDEMTKSIGVPGDPATAGPFVLGVIEGERDGDVGRVLNRTGIQPW